MIQLATSKLNYWNVLFQVACAGAVIAAAVSIDKWLDIKNNDLLYPFITNFDNNHIQTRTEATAALAIAAGVAIPVGIVMIILRLFKISLGALGRIIVILVCILYCNNYLYPLHFTYHTLTF